MSITLIIHSTVKIHTFDIEFELKCSLQLTCYERINCLEVESLYEIFSLH